MQLVAMVSVVLVVLVRAGQGCSNCTMTPTQITLEECGNVTIHTTICAGLCHMKDTVYESANPTSKSKICNGEWSYEVANVEGCPEGVTYPMATACWCDTCEESYTDCNPKPSSTPSCRDY